MFIDLIKRSVGNGCTSIELVLKYSRRLQTLLPKNAKKKTRQSR
jgi:hypothetical protein